MESAHERDGIRSELRGRVAIWTLARPAQLNALTVPMLERLARLVAEVRADPDVRAVVITGEGTRAFCAGADLKQRSGMSEAQVREFLDACGRAFDALDELDRPVIAALNGAALGGGLELALACDLRVAVPGAALGLSEVALGIIPGAGGSQRLPRTVGLARATQMILLAERVDAEEALRIGLIHRLTQDSDALTSALEWAGRFELGAPLALAAALDALRASSLPLADGLARERACYERVLVSADRREGLDAFLTKRAANFQGS